MKTGNFLEDGVKLFGEQTSGIVCNAA